MRKYSGLTDELRRRAHGGALEVELTFGEMDRLVGGLPPSARRLRTWWANSSHNQAQAWREAGWHVASVDMAQQRVVFARGTVGAVSTPRTAARWDSPRSGPATRSPTRKAARLLAENAALVQAQAVPGARIENLG